MIKLKDVDFIAPCSTAPELTGIHFKNGTVIWFDAHVCVTINKTTVKNGEEITIPDGAEIWIEE